MSKTPSLKARSSSGYSYYGTSSSSDLEFDFDTEHRIVKDHTRPLQSSSSSHLLIMGNPKRQNHGPGDSYSGRSSVEFSEPPSPEGGLPNNFGEVAPGIYRSAFPKLGNFEDMKLLGLKTILTLVPEDYPTENVEFVKANGIQHFQIPIPANKDPFVTIPPQDMAAALKLLLDRRYHPILIHCNKGKHRTGCVVGCYRKIHDWTTPTVLAEYRKHAGSKARVLDERFIELFDERAAMAGITMEDTMGADLARPLLLPTPPSSVVNDQKDEDP